MKAIQFTAASEMEVVDEENPVLKPGEVLFYHSRLDPESPFLKASLCRWNLLWLTVTLS